MTPGPEALKIITNTFLQNMLPLVNHSFEKLKDWNMLDNEAKESSTTLV